MYHTLNLMAVKPSRIELHTPDQILSFRSGNNIELSRRIQAIRTVLFDPSFVPFVVDIDPLLEPVYTSQTYKYETETPIADRYLSLVDSNNDKLSQLDLLFASCRILMNSEKKLLITERNYPVLQPFMNYVAKSVAFSPVTPRLCFEDLPSQSAFETIQIFNKDCSVLKRISFLRMSFPSDHFPKSKFVSTITEWTFFECVFNGSESSWLVSQLNANVSLIALVRCQFKDKTFSKFAAIFLKLPLEIVWFYEINVKGLVTFLEKLIKQPIQQKTLKCLTVRNCSINVAPLLSLLFSYSDGLQVKHIDFSDNECIYEASQYRPSVRFPAHTLRLANVKFNPLAFDQILKVCSNATSHYFSLDLTGAFKIKNLPKPDYNAFNYVTTLIFNSNPIDTQFFNFLFKMNSLVSISFDDCFTRNDKISLELLKQFLEAKPLRSFSIRASSPANNLGEELMPLLYKLCENSLKLKRLDICGQMIGDMNMVRLVDVLPVKTRSLCFKQAAMGHKDVLMMMLEVIRMRCLVKLELRDETNGSPFFWKKDKTLDRELEKFENRNRICREFIRMKERISSLSQTECDASFERYSFSVPDPTIESLVCECCGNIGHDPIMKIASNMRIQLNVDMLKRKPSK